MRIELDAPAGRIIVATPGPGAHEITSAVARAVEFSEVQHGLCHLFLRHTSASLVVQENADPTARADLESFLARLAPEGEEWATHTLEGPDDGPSHLRAALTNTSECLPVRDGRLALGTWQGIFLLEHRRRPHRRELLVTCVTAG